VKRKLVTVLTIFGYIGGSLSEEPPSPFDTSPFGAPASFDVEHHGEVSPFAEPPTGPSPFDRPEDSREMQEPFREPETSPFHPPVEQSPFGAPQEGREEHMMRPPSFNRPEFGRQEAPQFQERPVSEVSPEERSAVPSVGSSDHTEAPVQDQRMWEPAPDQSEKAEKVSPEDQAVEGEIDTLEREGSGNWLLKRVWWEKTEPVYEQIKQVFNDIMNARMDFISQRNRLDRELDVAYGQIGLEEGELQDMLDYCLNLAKQEKKEQGFLTKEEETLYNTLQHKQHDLEQIKLDVKALQEVDQKIDEALEALFKQIDIANQYEQKAWENFKEIARELNDKVARKSYYETEGLLKDIQNVQTYITGEFATYFNQTLQSARSHSQSISSQVNTLKQAGVDLKQQLDALERTQEAERVKKEIAEHDKDFEAAEKKKQEQKTKSAQAQDMMNQVLFHVKDAWLHFVDRVLHGFSGFISRVKGWFIKEETDLQNREKALELKISKELSHEQQDIKKEEEKVEKEEQGLPVQEEHSENTTMHEPEGRQYGEEKAEPEKTMKKDVNEKRAAQPENPFKVHAPAQTRPSVMPEQENPFAARTPEARPVSVMPHEPHNPVAVFGPPPVEHREPENPFVQRPGAPVLPPPTLPESTGHAVSPFVG